MTVGTPAQDPSIRPLPAAADGWPLLPSPSPVRLLAEPASLDESGRHRPDGYRPDGYRPRDYPPPADADLLRAYRAMVVGRRFDTQATALARQGRIAAFPSSLGQEASQIGAAVVLRASDWLFPTYRDSTALLARGLDPLDVLAPVRGYVHCGYDPHAVRCAPMTTPLATQAVHGTGLAAAARRLGEETVVVVLCGDGATSEGDFHEALNFAAVFRAPVVFAVQNNRYAISVPLAGQSAAPSLAHKGIGYGIPGEQVDGNDAAAVLAVLGAAVARARDGAGPMLVELHTYRMAPHTSTDDPGRYRDPAESERWAARDPILRLGAHLRGRGLLDDAVEAAVADEAEAVAAGVRAGVARDPVARPTEIFDHVYARPPAFLADQRAELAAVPTIARPGPGAAR